MASGRGRPWGSVALAVAAASALVLASSLARADSGDADGDLVPDDIEDRTQRNVAWTVSPAPAPRSLSLRSTSVGAPTDDWFRLEYGEGAFEVAYAREDVGGEGTAFVLSVVRLFEWSDENRDGAVEDGEISRDWSVGSAFENATIDHREASSADGGRVYTFGIRSAWRQGTNLDFVLTAAQRFLRMGPERVLTPMEVKMDVFLNHTFEMPGSRVGIEVRVETSDASTMTPLETSWDVERGFSRDESSINVTAGEPPSTTFFSWAKNATVDGVPGPLAVRVAPDYTPFERSYEILFAYPAGPDPASVRIVHDPTLGVVSAAYEGILLLPPPPGLQGDPFLYGVSLVGMAAVVGATVFLAGRRRRKAK